MISKAVVSLVFGGELQLSRMQVACPRMWAVVWKRHDHLIWLHTEDESRFTPQRKWRPLSWINPTGPQRGVCVSVTGHNIVFTVKMYKLLSVLDRKEGNFTLKHGDLVRVIFTGQTTRGASSLLLPFIHFSVSISLSLSHRKSSSTFSLRPPHSSPTEACPRRRQTRQCFSHRRAASPAASPAEGERKLTWLLRFISVLSIL